VVLIGTDITFWPASESINDGDDIINNGDEIINIVVCKMCQC